MKKITILGSAGSIGTQTLDVLRRFPDDFSVFGLCTFNEIDLMLEQISVFNPQVVCMVDKDAALNLKKRLNSNSPEILAGQKGLLELASMEDHNIVINAIVGAAGLLPSLKAIKPGVRLCTANKESLVIGGEIIMREIEDKQAELIPIDSEHSALLQASLSGHYQEIRRLILTASGGPFHNSDIDLKKVELKDALKHPNWSMGAKITIDSATMMNKGLEVIEAHWLFDIPLDQIEIVVHRQSIVHSIVEFIDGSQIAQASMPDMRLPIQYALTYPNRDQSTIPILNLADIGQLTFEEPDYHRFPCLKIAYRAMEIGGSAPCVMNAANEAAVQLFLGCKIRFYQIPEIVQNALESHKSISNPDIETLLAIDNEIKVAVLEKYDS